MPEETVGSFHNGLEYRGWNSAQQLDTVQVGKTHHGRLASSTCTSAAFKKSSTAKSNGRSWEHTTPNIRKRAGETSRWGKFLTPRVEFPDGDDTPARESGRGRDNCSGGCAKSYRHLMVQDRPRQHVKLQHRRSALLFGPPGTSKTTLVQAVAETLEWPYVEITPSDFLREGLGQIYEEANRIFEDLMDLSGVVILFDEMDALVQRRGAGEGQAVGRNAAISHNKYVPNSPSETPTRRQSFFWQPTTGGSLMRLSCGQVDSISCFASGPPTRNEKKEKLEEWISKSEDDRETCKDIMVNWVTGKDAVARMLDLFTYGEMKELFDYLRRKYGPLKPFLDKEKGRDFDRLERVVRDWYEKMITLRRGQRHTDGIRSIRQASISHSIEPANVGINPACLSLADTTLADWPSVHGRHNRAPCQRTARHQAERFSSRKRVEQLLQASLGLAETAIDRLFVILDADAPFRVATSRT